MERIDVLVAQNVQAERVAPHASRDAQQLPPRLERSVMGGPETGKIKGEVALAVRVRQGGGKQVFRQRFRRMVMRAGAACVFRITFVQDRAVDGLPNEAGYVGG